VQELLLDRHHLVAGHVLEDEPVPQAEDLAVHKEAVLAGLIFDGVVAPDGKELVLHQVAHRCPLS
jgi:hypothetical protein